MAMEYATHTPPGESTDDRSMSGADDGVTEGSPSSRKYDCLCFELNPVRRSPIGVSVRELRQEGRSHSQSELGEFTIP